MCPHGYHHSGSMALYICILIPNEMQHTCIHSYMAVISAQIQCFYIMHACIVYWNIYAIRYSIVCSNKASPTLLPPPFLNLTFLFSIPLLTCLFWTCLDFITLIGFLNVTVVNETQLALDYSLAAFELNIRNIRLVSKFHLNLTCLPSAFEH